MMMRPLRRSLAVLGLVLLCVSVPAAAAEAPAPADSEHPPIQVTWDVRVPTRDCVLLSATVYRDPRQTGRLPVIMTMTPYIADHAAKQGLYFAQNGSGRR